MNKNVIPLSITELLDMIISGKQKLALELTAEYRESQKIKNKRIA